MENQGVAAKAGNLAIRLWSIVTQKGLVYFIVSSATLAFDAVTWYPYYLLFKKRKFGLDGKEYGYLYRLYNTTWKNEREVELSIILELVEKNRGKKILEVGNVLSHYVTISHDVIDKYELGEGIVNEDAATYAPGAEYDLIVSISTLEHVGWDEEPKAPEKVALAIGNLKKALAPGGMLAATVPLGHNAELDRIIGEGKTFDKALFMKRVSQDNQWAQATWEEVKGAKYGEPFFGANAIALLVAKKESSDFSGVPKGRTA